MRCDYARNRVVVAGVIFLVAACASSSRPAQSPPPLRRPSSALFEPGGTRLVESKRLTIEGVDADRLDPEPDQAEPTMHVYLIDVGQGAATLLEFSCGAALIDTGGEGNHDYDSVASLHGFLEEFFARRTDLNRTLDLVVLTHPHTDHVRGGDTLLEHYTVKNVVTNGMKTGSGWKAQERFENGAKSAGAKVKKVNASSVPAGGLTNAVIDPIACQDSDPEIHAMWGQVARSNVEWSDKAFENENNHSVAVRVRFGKASILITGDLEFDGIEELIKRHGSELDVDVYQVGHHGSKNGTNLELLTEMTPSVVLIGAGPYDRELPWTAWDYGHPNVGIVKLIEANVTADHNRDHVDVKLGDGKHTFVDHTIEKPIYSTAWDGSVHLTLSLDGAVEARVGGP